MYASLKHLIACAIHATDGEIGKVDNFYFDDRHWVLRYVIVETGNWLFEREVLVSPVSIAGFDAENRTLSVDLTTKQIEDSPPVASAKPVSRQEEQALAGYFGWPDYWTGVSYGTSMAYMTMGPVPVPRPGEGPPQQRPPTTSGDPNLRSVNEIVDHYHLHARDGEIGHVDDIVVDTEHWCIRYFLIDTGKWLPGRKVLVGVDKVVDVSWGAAEVAVSVTREDVQAHLAYDPDASVTENVQRFQKG